MIEFILCIFLTIVLSVILLFCYTVIHAQDTVSKRNQSNELTEVLDEIRVMKSDFVRKIGELDELIEKLQKSNVTVVDRQKLDISLPQDNSDYISDPPSPGIIVTDAEESPYVTSPYSEATIRKNQEAIAAARRRSSALSGGSSRHSSNASIQAISKHVFGGRGSIQEAKSALQLALQKQNDVDFWERTRTRSLSFSNASIQASGRGSIQEAKSALQLELEFDNEQIIAARRRSSTWSQSSVSRRGSGDTELLPPEADIRRMSWPRVGGVRRRHSTFPPENMDKIQEKMEYLGIEYE